MPLDAACKTENTMSDLIHNTTPEQRAVTGLMLIMTGQTDVRSGWLGYGAALNEIKERHPGDKEFGKAVAAAKLDTWPEACRPNVGQDEIKRDVRVAAMWAAGLTSDELPAYESQHPSTQVTALGGFRGLHAAVLKASKPKPEKINAETPEQDAPATDVATATADDEASFQRGYLAGIEAAKAEGYFLSADDLPKTAQQKLQAALKRELKGMEAEYQRLIDERVEQIIGKELPSKWQAKLDHADEITRSHRGVMTKSELNILLACLHPDSRMSASDEKLAEAFRIIRSVEIPLLPGDATAPSAPDIARTREELMARKARVDAQRKAEREARRAAKAEHAA